jgi:signal transduction histidine kinase
VAGKTTEERADILLVEDDAELAGMVSVLIESHGHSVIKASSGTEALHLLGLDKTGETEQAAQPDLVLLDVHLKGQDGYEVLKRIRQNRDLDTVPVIMLTIVNTLENTVKALAAGANDYVTKPFKNPELLARVEAQLRVKRLQDERDRAEQALERRTQELRALTARLAEAEEAERRRISRELHDQVGQSLTALGINLNIVRSQMGNSDTEPLAARLDDSLAMVEQTTDRIRHLMADLRPPVLDDYGLIAAVRWYCEQLAARTGIKCRVEGDEPEPRLPIATETALFRIAQEALTNVAKHARASEVTVSIVAKPRLVRVVVADEGIGFEVADPPAHGRWGLLTMAERAEAVGGECIIRSRPGEGTEVVVEVRR